MKKPAPLKILITTSSFAVAGNVHLTFLGERGFEIVLNPYGRKITPDELVPLLDDSVVGMIAGVESLSRAALERAKGLKVISRCGIGLESVDLEAALERGIRVVNTPDAPTAAVAELTIGLILAALRRIAEADRGIRAGHWQGLSGRLLGACTVGLIGYGRIGRAVGGLARAFGATTIACDPWVEANRLSPADLPCPLVDLATVLRQADVVSLHIPGGPDNDHLIDAARLGLMKKDAVLVNTARGDLIDEGALFLALQGKQLAAAALDVFSEEPYTGPLITLPNVVLTSHLGSRARETRDRMENEAARNLVRELQATTLPTD